MKRICLHWTAGGPKANAVDLAHYHRIVEQDGNIRLGRFRPEANIPRNGRSLDGQPSSTYANHCGGGNSFAIGWALCGMSDFKGIQNPGKIGLTRVQFEAACKGMAQDCQLYNIPIEPETLFTHYEFGKANPHTSSRGKIDILYLPFEPGLKANEIGDYIRGKVRWYFQKLR